MRLGASRRSFFVNDVASKGLQYVSKRTFYVVCLTFESIHFYKMQHNTYIGGIWKIFRNAYIIHYLLGHGNKLLGQENKKRVHDPSLYNHG